MVIPQQAEAQKAKDEAEVQVNCPVCVRVMAATLQVSINQMMVGTV